ncbi:MAG: hypothetical protein QXR48_04520 [Candidatus Woesearchaeota archaeon]
MKNSSMQTINDFLDSIAIDCYETVPDTANIVIVCKPLENRPGGSRVLSFSAVYSANNEERGRHDGVVQYERGEKQVNYGVLFGEYLNKYCISTSVYDDYLPDDGKKVLASIVEIHSKGLHKKVLDAGTAAGILGKSTANVVNCFYRLNKHEPVGTELSMRDLFRIARLLKVSDNEFLKKVEKSSLCKTIG